MPQQHRPERWRSPRPTEALGYRLVWLRGPPLKPESSPWGDVRRCWWLPGKSTAMPTDTGTFCPHPFDPSPFFFFFYYYYLFHLSFPKGHFPPSQALSSLLNRGSFQPSILSQSPKSPPRAGEKQVVFVFFFSPLLKT